MAAEIEKLAQDLKDKGYAIGGGLLSDFALSLREKNLIPDFLSNNEFEIKPITLEELGSIVKGRRKELGIPLAVVARKAKVARTTLYVLERGDPKTQKPSRISARRLTRIMNVLQISPTDQIELLKGAGYIETP